MGNQAVLRSLRAEPDDLAVRSRIDDVPRFAAQEPPDRRTSDDSTTERRLARALSPPSRAPSPDVLVQRASAGHGRGLDTAQRRAFEPHLGVDLSGVRVHTDAAANEASRALGARAFTRGGDIFFAAGRSPGDRRLLAHELAHVAQQSTGRTGALQGLAGSEATRSNLEAEADSFANQGSSPRGTNAHDARPATLAPPRPPGTGAPIQLDTEGDMDAALHQRFAATDRDGVERHRARLRAICEAAAPAEASSLLARLSSDVPARSRRRDPLAERFRATLHVEVRRELLAILARRAAAPTATTAPSPTAATTPSSSPAIELPTSTGPLEFAFGSSTSQQIGFHTRTQRDRSRYIERDFIAAAYGVIDGYSVFSGSTALEISVPHGAVDFGVEAIEDVGGSQVFGSAAQALAAVDAAGGRNAGERRRVAYYRIGDVIVPTLFCPGTTPRIIAGWLEAHRRVGEVAGAMSDLLAGRALGRIFNPEAIIGRTILRFSQTAPLTAREAVRRILMNRVVGRAAQAGLRPPPPAPGARVQWGAPTRGGEATGAPPPGFGQRPAAAPTGRTTASPHPPPVRAQPVPPRHAAATRANPAPVPPSNAAEEEEAAALALQPPVPRPGTGNGPAAPRQPAAQLQPDAGGGAAPAVPRQPRGQQAAGGGGSRGGPAPVPDMDRHPLWTPQVQVWGVPQALQADRTMQFVRDAIASGRYSHIVINRGLGRAVGIPNASTGTPDVVLISRSGTVHVVEIQSTHDRPGMYRAQLQQSLRFLYERRITSSGGRVLRLDGRTERYMYDASIPEVERRLVRIPDN